MHDFIKKPSPVKCIEKKNRNAQETQELKDLKRTYQIGVLKRGPVSGDFHDESF